MKEKLLEIKKISKIYRRSNGAAAQVTEALKELSFDLHKGEIFALLGVNGAGKTTLSSILATLHPPSGGDLLWRGRSVYEQLLAFRRIIGYCPQKTPKENNLTIEEQLTFSARCYGLSEKKIKERKEQLIDEFDLVRYAKSYESELSGGYRQRFHIARALIHDPELVILDEPTVGLDPHIRRQLWEVIRRLRGRGITVLLTTHYLDEAEELSDRVCLIHAGAARTIDTPKNLKAHHQKNSLEEVFLLFVDDPDALIFNAGGS